MIIHQAHEHGEVTVVTTPYSPHDVEIPRRKQRAPYYVTLFYEDEPDHPAGFVTFDGETGRQAAIDAALGPRLPRSGHYCKRLIDQIDQFLHRRNRRVFTDVRQAAYRLYLMWVHLQFTDRVCNSFRDQAIRDLRAIWDGTWTGFDADFALHSWCGYFNQNYACARNLEQSEEVFHV